MIPQSRTLEVGIPSQAVHVPGTCTNAGKMINVLGSMYPVLIVCSVSMY